MEGPCGEKSVIVLFKRFDFGGVEHWEVASFVREIEGDCGVSFVSPSENSGELFRVSLKESELIQSSSKF